jgi:hypothetical protein
MINIEKCALRPLKEDFLTTFKGTMKIHNRVADEGAQLFSSLKITFADLAKANRFRAQCLEDSIVLKHLGLQLFRENNRLHQIGHPQTRARSFVSVGRADPAFGCSNPGPALAQFPLLVEEAVIRQNQMSAVADEQILADCDAQVPQAVDLGDKSDRIDNNTIADHTNFCPPEDSRRDEMQNVFDAPMNDRVPGVVSALAADHNVGFAREHVDNLAFSLIAPLRPN